MGTQRSSSPAFLQMLERLIDVLLFAFVIFVMVSISAMQTAYILACAAWLLRYALHGSSQPLRWPLLVPVTGFFVTSILSTLTASEPYRSLPEIRNVFEIAMFYLVVNHVRSTQQATRLTEVLIATGALMALYGLGQSVWHGAVFRIHGTMSIYMTFAGLLMLVDVIALAQLLFHAQPRQRLWCLPALLLHTTAILLTQTRNAWLGLLTGFAVVLGWRKPALLLVLPVGALVATVLAPHVVQERLRSIVDPRDLTARQRLYVWHNAIDLIRTSPLLGVGMRNIPRPALEYRDPEQPEATKRLRHLHNNVLQVATERGLLGLACWLAIWGAYVYHVWPLYRRLGPQAGQAKALIVGSLGSVVGFQVAGIFEHNFGDSEVITLVYFLMALPFVACRTRAGDPTSGASCR